jgi:hypothetical protein
MTTESTEGQPDPGYKYIGGAGAPEEEERPGCLDLLAATAGMGCAVAIRGVIILAGLILLYLLLRYAVGGGGKSPHPTPTPGHVLGQSVDRWAFALFYCLDLEKQFVRRIVDEFHARVHRFGKLEALPLGQSADDDLDDGKRHLAQ